MSKSTAALLLAVLALLVSLGANIVGAHEVSKNHSLAVKAKSLAQEGVHAHIGICALRTDIAERIQNDTEGLANTKAYVKRHPHGVLGLTRSQLDQAVASAAKNLTREKATYGVLAVVGCA